MKKFTVLSLIFLCLSCEYKTELPQTLEINSQADLNEWACELEGITVYEGNIYIRPTEQDTLNNITDLSVFNSIKKINGDLLIANTNLASLNGFQNLVAVNNIFIGSNNLKLKGIIFSNLQFIHGSINLFNLKSVTNLELPKLEKCLEISATDCQKLEILRGAMNLEFLINFVVQRCNLQTIEGFDNLGYCEDRLDLEFANMKVSQASFKKFQSANRISITAYKHDGNFTWLGAIKNYGAFTIAGPIELKELCPIKPALLSQNFALFNWQGSNVVIYNSANVENECK